MGEAPDILDACKLIHGFKVKEAIRVRISMTSHSCPQIHLSLNIQSCDKRD